MRLSTKAFAITCGLIWGGAILLVGILNLAFASYGADFLQFVSSIYPGFNFTRSFGDVLVGTAYGLVDGGVGGLVFAWLYNVFARPQQSA
jgi:hypothetical protein